MNDRSRLMNNVLVSARLMRMNIAESRIQGTGWDYMACALHELDVYEAHDREQKGWKRKLLTIMGMFRRSPSAQ